MALEYKNEINNKIQRLQAQCEALVDNVKRNLDRSGLTDEELRTIERADRALKFSINAINTGECNLNGLIAPHV